MRRLSRHSGGFLLAFIVTAGALLVLATLPTEQPLGTGSAHLNHILAFYVLALLLDLAFPQRPFGLGKVLALLAFGTLIEVLQYFLPLRQFSLVDILMDAVGVLLYALSRPLLRRLPVLRWRWS